MVFFKVRDILKFILNIFYLKLPIKLFAPIIQIKSVKAGERISYGLI